jgi:hypothetical protein
VNCLWSLAADEFTNHLSICLLGGFSEQLLLLALGMGGTENTTLGVFFCCILIVAVETCLSHCHLAMAT